MTGDAVFLIEGAGLLEFVGWWFFVHFHLATSVIVIYSTISEYN